MFVAFFLVPLARLFAIGGTGALGWSAYAAVFTESRYLSSLASTVALRLGMNGLRNVKLTS